MVQCQPRFSQKEGLIGLWSRHSSHHRLRRCAKYRRLPSKAADNRRSYDRTKSLSVNEA